MREDLQIEELVKGAMESDVMVSEKTLRALETAAAHEATARRCRRSTWLKGGLLVAAALTVVLFFGNVFHQGTASDGMAEVREAVGLLCAVDGLDEDLTSFPPGEMLLAWQDAPCVDLL